MADNPGRRSFRDLRSLTPCHCASTARQLPLPHLDGEVWVAKLPKIAISAVGPSGRTSLLACRKLFLSSRSEVPTIYQTEVGLCASFQFPIFAKWD